MARAGTHRRPHWRALPVPLAIILVTGVLVPLFGTLLRIGGSPRVVIAYATDRRGDPRRGVAGRRRA